MEISNPHYLLMKQFLGFVIIMLFSNHVIGQADNEIQVYASPTIGKQKTIIELHTNYTFKGSEFLINPHDAHWTNLTVEVTHGLSDNIEVGVYLFTAISPDGTYQYLGNQIRPRVTVPSKWDWPVGASLSLEVGLFRPDIHSDYIWQGELRPIIDKSIGNMYLAFNPNIEFTLTGKNQQVALTPQFKAMYAIKNKIGIGFEEYSFLGILDELFVKNQQEYLLGPMFDLLVSPDWELNTGFLFGLTDFSNQSIVKVLVGHRFSKK